METPCPECESLVEIDVDVVEEGDSIECEECGAELEVVSLEPLRVVHETYSEDEEGSAEHG